jgi:hypothetical protein
LFSYRTDGGYFRLVRRAGRWFVEWDGLVSRTFDSPEAAARAAGKGESGLPAPASDRPPAALAEWTRGDLPPVWPARPPPGGARILNSPDC